MICELETMDSFLNAWLLLTTMGLGTLFVFSGPCFLHYYVNVTFEKWQWKSNPKFPTPEMVKFEILQMLKGLFSATICPALSLYLTRHGMTKGFCGMEEYGFGYHVFLFTFVWIASDFYEFFYHHLGHRFNSCWEQHKHHHVFYNPSPFAVIADEYVDQFVRSAPLLLFPLMIPMNMDLMFVVFGIMFYGYGTYLHCGYEHQALSSHNPYINTAFQHYLHHAISIKNKPYHTGFFFKIWDQMFGTIYDGKTCICAEDQIKAGLRTKEAFDKVHIPDYSVLLTPSFWWDVAAQKLHELSAEDNTATKDSDNRTKCAKWS